MIEEDPEHFAVLQNIESFIVAVYRKHRDMRDTAVMFALDAAIRYFNDVRRGHTPKEPRLDGHSQEVFAAVKDICNMRLGREDFVSEGGTNVALNSDSAVSAEVVVTCLRKVRKSVDRWNNQAGRQGYLKFISQFT